MEGGGSKDGRITKWEGWGSEGLRERGGVCYCYKKNKSEGGAAYNFGQKRKVTKD